MLYIFGIGLELQGKLLFHSLPLIFAVDLASQFQMTFNMFISINLLLSGFFWFTGGHITGRPYNPLMISWEERKEDGKTS